MNLRLKFSSIILKSFNNKHNLVRKHYDQNWIRITTGHDSHLVYAHKSHIFIDKGILLY